MRIEYLIREDECNGYFNKFFPLLLLKKHGDSKWEAILILVFKGLSDDCVGTDWTKRKVKKIRLLIGNKPWLIKKCFYFYLFIYFFILADLKIFDYLDLLSFSSTPIKSEQLDDFEKQARVHNRTTAPLVCIPSNVVFGKATWFPWQLPQCTWSTRPHTLHSCHKRGLWV